MDISNAINLVTMFSEESIDYVNCCRDILNDLIVVELIDDEWTEVDSTVDIQRMRNNMIHMAVGEGYVDNRKEFDEIYDALDTLANSGSEYVTNREFTIWA